MSPQLIWRSPHNNTITDCMHVFNSLKSYIRNFSSEMYYSLKSKHAPSNKYNTKILRHTWHHYTKLDSLVGDGFQKTSVNKAPISDQGARCVKIFSWKPNHTYFYLRDLIKPYNGLRRIWQSDGVYLQLRRPLHKLEGEFFIWKKKKTLGEGKDCCCIG